MGKMSELDMAIKDLRTAAATINDVANSLAEPFGCKASAESSVFEILLFAYSVDGGEVQVADLGVCNHRNGQRYVRRKQER